MGERVQNNWPTVTHFLDTWVMNVSDTRIDFEMNATN